MSSTATSSRRRLYALRRRASSHLPELTMMRWPLSLSVPLPFHATTLSSPLSMSLPLPFPRHRPFLAPAPRGNWCSQVQSNPTVTWEAEEGKLYTLVMTDPDAPTRSDPKWGEWYARRLHPPDVLRLCVLTKP